MASTSAIQLLMAISGLSWLQYSQYVKTMAHLNAKPAAYGGFWQLSQPKL